MKDKMIVRFRESIAGFADPNQAALDRKYAGMRARLEAQGMRLKAIEGVIDQQKEIDRYGDVCRGMKHDFYFKPGEEAAIPAKLAEAWIENGVCIPIEAFSQQVAQLRA